MTDQSADVAHRPLKILHIGNIANNAYNNAKILTERGHTCHVVAYDYFHIISCPEWEDADVGDAKLDNFYPDWWSSDLNSSPRPRWFVQARYMDALKHLRLMNGDSRFLEWVSWCRITYDRFRMVKTRKWTPDAEWRYRGFLKILLSKPPRLKDLTTLAVGAFSNLVCDLSARSKERNDQGLFRGMMARSLAFAENKTSPENVFTRAGYHTFSSEHLQRVSVAEADALPYSSVIEYWREIFDFYDVVIGYSTDPALPMLAGLEKYAAYEHGTLRAIPFADDAQGRLCSASYRNAAVVLITNTDNLAAADRLGLTSEQRVCLPHAFDQKKLQRFQAAHPPEQLSDGTVVFMAPARHDWIRNDPNWSKGNDKIFRAAAPLAKAGKKFIIKCISWGVDLEASKALVIKLKLENHVQWLEVMPKKDLWLEYINAHAVIDQFVISGMSGVTFEALTFGRRVITMDDGKINARFFAVPPPLLSVMTVKDLTARLRQVIDDADDKAGIGEASAQWIEDHHSKRRTAEIQEEAFTRMLDQQRVVTKKTVAA
jgi:glycosyltransferase involved in cell wall biosynthesis